MAKSSSWIKDVTKYYHTQRKLNPNYKFRNALVDMSKLKNKTMKNGVASISSVSSSVSSLGNSVFSNLRKSRRNHPSSRSHKNRHHRNNKTQKVRR